MGTLFQVDGVTGSVDFKQKESANLVLENDTTLPGSGVEGQIFWKSDVDTLFVHNGTSFMGIGAGYNRVYNEVPAGLVNGSNTLFTLANSYVAGTLTVSRDGLIMKGGGVDYTETSPVAGTITFVTAPAVSSVILVSYSRIEAAMLPSMQKESMVVGTPSANYTGSTTVFNLSFAYTVGNNALLVYSSGVLMRAGVGNDYVETSSSVITFNSARTAGEIIQFVKLGYNDATGETNTNANVGTGTGTIFRDKIGSVMNLKTLKAGTSISLTNNADDITISASVAAAGGWTDTGSVVTLDTATDQVQIGTGSGATPALAFVGDADTGFYRITDNVIGITTNGSARWRIEDDVIRNIVGGGRLNVGDGTVANPSLSFENDNNTGFYRGSTDRIDVALNGISYARFMTTGFEVNVPSSSGIMLQTSYAGNILGMFVDNQSNTASSDSRMGLRVAGTSAGDPYQTFSVISGSTWAIGTDNSDSDRFKVSAASSLGSNDYVIIDPTTGFVAMGANATQGPAFSFQDNSTSDLRQLLYKNNATGDPYTNWSTNATNWSMGIDNSDSDVLNITEGNALGGVNTRLRMPTGGQLQMMDGSAGAPQYAFINGTADGMYRSGTNQVSFALAGTKRLELNGTAMTWKNAGSHAYFYIDRANNTSEGLTIFSTGGTNSAAVGLDNDGTEKLCFFTNNDLGTPKVTIDTGGTTTFVESIRQKNGSASAPSYTFSSATTSGFYFVGSDVAITLSGTQRGQWEGNQYQQADGTASLPAFAFTNDVNTGIYRSGTDEVGVSSNGAKIFQFGSSSNFSYSHLIPDTTNTWNCGDSTHKWSDVWGTTIHSGDIELENFWRITEGDKIGHPEEGVMFLSPTGKKYKIHMTEVE